MNLNLIQFFTVFFRKIYSKLFPNYTIPKLIDKLIIDCSKILEIGGPTRLFYKSSLYNRNVSFANYSLDNVWDSNCTILFDPVNNINQTREKFDFLIMSHVLEHTSNPILYLRKLKLILETSAKLLIVLPDSDFCFDISRKITSFDHLKNDYNTNIDESDLTHRDEFLSEANRLLISNYNEIVADRTNSYRMIHHHVFSIELFELICDYVNLTILESGKDNNGNIYFICEFELS